MADHRCTEAIWRKGDYRKSLCGKPAKHDPVDGVPTKCGTHSAEGKAKHEAKQNAAYQLWQAERQAKIDVSLAEKNLEGAMRAIAEGHGDPAGLAAQAIGRLDYERATLRALRGEFG